jgi:hypothetical protein
MRAIIMADGAGDRWLSSVRGTEFEGIPKQLIKIEGRNLLWRTTAYLSTLGIHDIWVTSHDPKMDVPGVKRYEPENNEHCLDKLHACKEIWKSPTLFLYGDVYYTFDALTKMVSIPVKDRFLFFGRMNVSYYSQHGHEIFCKKIEDFDYLEECINWIKAYEPSYGGGWELYRRMCGITDLNRIRLHIPYDHFISIDDFTEDFDEYEIYLNWLKGRTNGLRSF